MQADITDSSLRIRSQENAREMIEQFRRILKGLELATVTREHERVVAERVHIPDENSLDGGDLPADPVVQVLLAQRCYGTGGRFAILERLSGLS